MLGFINAPSDHNPLPDNPADEGPDKPEDSGIARAAAVVAIWLTVAAAVVAMLGVCAVIFCLVWETVK